MKIQGEMNSFVKESSGEGIDRLALGGVLVGHLRVSGLEGISRWR